MNINDTQENFDAFLRCQCRDKEDFHLNWLRPYENLNNLTFRVSVTRPRTGKSVVYKAVYRCERNTYPRSHKRRVQRPHEKHTGCPSIIRVTIKASTVNRRVRTQDTLRAVYPTLIRIVHKHNHEIMPPEPAKYQKLSPSLQEDSNEEDEYVVEYLHEDSAFMEQYLNQEKGFTECVCEEIVQTESINERTSVTDNQSCNNNNSDWSSLKERFNLMFEKWETGNSLAHCRALQEVITYLENCETESDSLSALHCLGTYFEAKKIYSTYIPIQPAKIKVQFEEQNFIEIGQFPKNTLEDHIYFKTEKKSE